MYSAPETKLQFPRGFLIGSASSSHQVEGGNIGNDWWQAEMAGTIPKSGKVTDHYHRFEEDFKIAEEMGLNVMRIGLEWSRIEPQQGEFDREAIEHYRAVLQSMKRHGLTRMVTLWHYTLPQWLSDRGGVLAPDSAQLFARYAHYVTEQLGDEIDLWMTINEPEVYSQLAYMRGLWPPFGKSVVSMLRVFHRLMTVHKAMYRAIKKVRPEAKISFAKNNVYFEPHRGALLNRLVVWFSNFFTNHYFVYCVRNYIDWFGLNYYFYHTLHVSIFRGIHHVNTQVGPRSDMGWRTYPRGLYHVLKDLLRFGKPIYITENGIANAHDDMRQRFIYEHLEAVCDAIADGVPVKGYCYWTLTDTYEWHDGYNPKFGLVEINFDTLERRVRPSARVFKERITIL